MHLLMPGTDVAMVDTVLAEDMVDTVLEAMVDTEDTPDTPVDMAVLDTVMVDIVASDPLMPHLMPGTDVVMDMAVMVDTEEDMVVMEVMAVDTVMASKYFTTPKKR
jgi:hypothetical protein